MTTSLINSHTHVLWIQTPDKRHPCFETILSVIFGFFQVLQIMIVHVLLSIFVSNCVIFSTYPYVANQVYINSSKQTSISFGMYQPKREVYMYIYIYINILQICQMCSVFKIHVCIQHIYIYLHTECSALILVEDQCCYVYLQLQVTQPVLYVVCSLSRSSYWCL